MQAAPGASLNPSGHTDSGASDETRSRSRLTLFLVVGLAAWAVDVVTKVLAVRELSDRAPVHVVGDLLQLTLVRNPGAAFSMATSYTPVLSVIALVAGVVVCWIARRVRSIGWAVALGFLLAGLLGNLTDRVFRTPGVLHGHVVDFLMLPHWPVFNVADICINLAAALIVIQAVRGIRLDGTRTDSDPAG